MNKLFFVVCCSVFLQLKIQAQASLHLTNPLNKYEQAKSLFLNEAYGLAYPLLAELKQDLKDNQQSNYTYLYDDINYFYIATELKLKQSIGVTHAKQYFETSNNVAREQQLSYHLAHYYFGLDDFENAVKYYELAGVDNITNEYVADAKFERAYSYFNLGQYNKSKALFYEITQLPDNKYYVPANYYYGFIAYKDGELSQALKYFKLVETKEEYIGVVPYYITEIYYLQGKKDDALRYGEAIIQKGTAVVYNKELNLLLGQLYFEKKNFAKAEPLIEAYVNTASKVDKEVLYELSYCYYESKKIDKAIEGFKQLSSLKDSMGQNSMYLLGDCYLQKGDKENARTAFQYCSYNSSHPQQQKVSKFLYAKLSYELGDNTMALQEIKAFLAKHPNSEYETEAREILVNVLANTSNFKEGLEVYTAQKTPSAAFKAAYPKILFGRAVELFNDQELAQANDLFTKLLAENSPNAEVLKTYANFYKGEIAYKNNKYDEAVPFLAAFEKANPKPNGEATVANANYSLGYCFFKKENYKQAQNYFEQVAKNVTTTSTNIEQDAYARAADCYFMQRDYAKANSMYDNLINAASPASDYALLQKAVIAGIKNSTEKIKLLNQLSKQYPNSYLVPDAQLEIATTYMNDERFKEAIPYLNNLLSNKNAQNIYAKAYFNLGLCHYNTNNNTAALSNYESLLTKYPNTPEAEDAIDNIKNIYVEDGRPNDYVVLMQRVGKPVAVSEADSLSYTAAMLKYSSNDCTAANQAFNSYLQQYPNGNYATQIYFLNAECYEKAKKITEAITNYAAVSAKGPSLYFERATYQAAQLNYFELKNYAEAKKYFTLLLTNAGTQETKLGALRGLVRCNYQLKDYTAANETAKELLQQKAISTDDKAVANLVLGKSLQLANDCTAAITAFKACAAVNKAAWGAEARYEIAACHFKSNNLAAAEKAAIEVTKQTASYDLWVTKSYILLGDIFYQQKDFFNAKATYESVALNAIIPELKTEAQTKLDKVIAEEKLTSKITN
jgi:TolA-binding protein